jgi:hypothetical protein
MYGLPISGMHFPELSVEQISILTKIFENLNKSFRDCPEAAAELRSQIIQAREDLSSKGLKFE